MWEEPREKLWDRKEGRGLLLELKSREEKARGRVERNGRERAPNWYHRPS